jgi:hypothetical protein
MLSFGEIKLRSEEVRLALEANTMRKIVTLSDTESLRGNLDPSIGHMEARQEQSEQAPISLERNSNQAWRYVLMASTSPAGQIGGYRREMDFQKLGPALVIASSLVLAIRRPGGPPPIAMGWQIWNGKRK